MKLLKDYLKSDTFILGISYYINLFFALLRGLIVSKVLKPEFFGIWSTMLIILSYASYSHMGYFFTLVKDVPVIDSKERRRYHCSVLLVFSVTISIILATLFLIYFSIFFSGNPFFRKGCLIISLSIIFETVIHFSHKYFRAVEDFKSLYRYTIFSSFLSFGLIAFSVIKWHFMGLLVSYTVCNFVLMIAPFIFFKVDVNLFKLDFGLLKKKFYLAIKYLLLDILGNTFRNLDKILIVRFFSFFSLGIYAFFYRIIQPINIFFDAVLDVMFPKIVRIENQDPKKAVAYLKDRLRFISVFFLLLLPLYIFSVLILVNIFLKEYAIGNKLIVYLPALFYLYTFNNAMMVYLISNDSEIFIKATLAISIGIFFLTSFVFAKSTGMYAPIIFCNIFASIVQLLSYSIRIFRNRFFKPVSLCFLNICLIFTISYYILEFFNKFGINLIRWITT